MAAWLPHWLPRHMVPGIAFSRLGILVFHAREPKKAFAKIPTGKASSQAAYPPSLHPSGHRACAGMKLRHHAAHRWALGIRKESGQALAFRFSGAV